MEEEPIEHVAEPKHEMSNDDLLNAIAAKILKEKKPPVSKKKNEQLIIARKGSSDKNKREKERLKLLADIEKNGWDLNELSSKTYEKPSPKPEIAPKQERLKIDW